MGYYLNVKLNKSVPVCRSLNGGDTTSIASRFPPAKTPELCCASSAKNNLQSRSMDPGESQHPTRSTSKLVGTTKTTLEMESDPDCRSHLHIVMGS